MRRRILKHKLFWARLIRNDILELQIRMEIIMADTTTLDANVDRLNAALDRIGVKVQADADALAAATADTQPVIDAAAAAVGAAADKADAIAPVPAS